MARKIEGSVLSKRLSVAVVILAIYALLMIFMPAIAIKDSNITYTGMQVVFGYTTTQDLGFLGTLVNEYFGFSVLNLLPYAFILVAFGLLIVKKLGIGNKWFTLVAALLFILAAVFFFLQVSFCVTLKQITEEIKANFILGNGSILAAISSALAGFLLFGKTALK